MKNDNRNREILTPEQFHKEPGAVDKHGEDLPEIRNWKWSDDGNSTQ